MNFKWKPILIIIFGLIIVSAVFFIITTTMSSPIVMELKMPKDEPRDYNKASSNATLTLVLLNNNMLYGYFGNNISDGSNLEIKDARKIILDGVQKFTKDSLIVVIKPSEEASYKNTVAILDELAINDIKKYSMVDLSKEEKEFINKSQPKL